MIDPKSWNRYSYTLNNPLVYVDHNGKWPTKIHDQIIDKAFPGLSTAQRAILKQVSRDQDNFLKGGQENKNSYKHSMRAPNEKADDARFRAALFTVKNEAAAQVKQNEYQEKGGKGLSDDALKDAGKAIHTQTDRTSPAHTDKNGDPIVWSLGDIKENIRHILAESRISPEQMDAAVEAARQSFRRALGDKALEAAAKEQTQKEKEKEKQE